jgi:outer membrane protein insertion porin family
MYFAKGFPDVRIEAEVERIQNGTAIQTIFNIAEGESYKIGKILVAGNTLTAEKIVHRNSNLYPNTPYDPEAILESQQRLYATGLFTRVDIVALQEEPVDGRYVLIQLEDAKPILVTPGVGYQESEGPRGLLEISHTNLFGLDRSISLRLRGSRREQLSQITYHEPRLFNWNWEGIGSLLVERTHQVKYDSSRFDVSLQALKKLSTEKNLLITASYQTVNLSDVRLNPRAGEFQDQTGVIQISRIGASYIRDRRNDPIDPSRGSFNTTTFQVASRLLASEVNFTSFFNQSSFYRPLNSAVLATSVRFGWNQPFGDTFDHFPPTGLAITERYFAGGSTTLRGFAQDKAGPEGGGTTMAIGNVEYRFPMNFMPISHVGGALFYDTGNVFSKISDFDLRDFTHTGGVGLRYRTPLGPVRLDFGFNLHPKIDIDGNREKRLHVFFTLGHTF